MEGFCQPLLTKAGLFDFSLIQLANEGDLLSLLLNLLWCHVLAFHGVSLWYTTIITPWILRVKRVVPLIQLAQGGSRTPQVLKQDVQRFEPFSLALPVHASPLISVSLMRRPEGLQSVGFYKLIIMDIETNIIGHLIT